MGIDNLIYKKRMLDIDPVNLEYGMSKSLRPGGFVIGSSTLRQRSSFRTFSWPVSAWEFCGVRLVLKKFCGIT